MLSSQVVIELLMLMGIEIRAPIFANNVHGD